MNKTIAQKQTDCTPSVIRQAESVYDRIIEMWEKMEALPTEEKSQEAMAAIVFKAVRGDGK